MVDLISIHIPKTAGRSFLAILNSVYGSSIIAHYERKNYADLPIAPVTRFKSQLNDSIKVIHGHFKFMDVSEIKDHHSSKVITWLRDPVERVISNYGFFMKRISLAPDDTELQARKNESLLDYARLEESKNRMSKFTEGLDINQFFFIGLTENFDSDIHELGRKLSWKFFNVPRLNDNGEFKSALPTVSTETRKIIEDLNGEDIELYRRVVELRHKKSV